jgi:hypothetical protein
MLRLCLRICAYNSMQKLTGYSRWMVPTCALAVLAAHALSIAKQLLLHSLSQSCVARDQALAVYITCTSDLTVLVSLSRWSPNCTCTACECALLMGGTQATCNPQMTVDSTILSETVHCLLSELIVTRNTIKSKLLHVSHIAGQRRP